jgi:hypothetical protein
MRGTRGILITLMVLLQMAAGCGQGVPCGDLAGLSPALAEFCADGVLDCDEHYDRYLYNECPDVPPGPGVDEQGVSWVPDLFLGVLPNPYHANVECWRGSSSELGVSSYQCCYDGGQLVADGPRSGSFDLVNPFVSPQTLWEHYLLDILPYEICR